MKTLWIFGNQLSLNFAGFQMVDKSRDRILMIEASSRSNWKKYHKKKLVLIFSAMRHFAKALKEQGYEVDYRYASSFAEGFFAHAEEFNPAEIILHEPTDWHMRRLLRQWEAEQLAKGLSITFLQESLFLVKEEEWETLLPMNGTWKLDGIYQKLRRRFDILMENDKPIGGKWSYDQENRKPPKKGLIFHPPLLFSPDSITSEVMAYVEKEFCDNPGSTAGFSLPVTEKEAYEGMEQFILHRLKTFGDYQDAMIDGLPFMSHSLISSGLNLGLLKPLDVILLAQKAYHEGLAPLSATEGFIRQILGWREYIRGIYLRKMPDYQHVNTFRHQRPLPAFYWGSKTAMHCLSRTVGEVIENGYNHHIQRLMILGNFANLAGIIPQDVADWFNTMYTDAHDWVVLPNVLGMALYADDGAMSTKPYISSGQYIHKMSNYCEKCTYDVNDKYGEKACPFHCLYWDFLMRHEGKLRQNPRMSLMYKVLDKMASEEKERLKNKAWHTFALLDENLL